MAAAYHRLERAFLNRVWGLPTATRTLLLVIAENDSRLLREVFDAGEVLLGESVGLDVLAPAVPARLIEIDETEVRFRHPLVCSAVHQSAGPKMRNDVHAALARVIKDQSDRAIWHRMASTVGPDDTLPRSSTKLPRDRNVAAPWRWQYSRWRMRRD